MLTVRKKKVYDITGASRFHCDNCKYRGVSTCAASNMKLSNNWITLDGIPVIAAHRLQWCIDGETDEKNINN